MIVKAEIDMSSKLPFCAVVTGIGSYVPERVLTNTDLEKMVDTSDEWIVSRTGIRERHILEDGKATSDMAKEAVSRALADANVKSESVDAVICATYTADLVFPSTACLLQSKLELGTAACFDIEAACCGFIYGLAVGANFLESGMYKRVLVIGADASSRALDWDDRNTCVLFGDGAAAVVLEARPMPKEQKDRRGLLASYLRSDGNGWSQLHQPAGGSQNPPTHETVDERQHFIKMKGREIFKVAGKAMAEAGVQVAQKAGLEMDDIDLVVPHQANLRIIQATKRRLGLDDDKMIINIERYGNTVAASIGIALDEAYRQGRVKDGANILLVGFGAGYTWGGSVIRWGS